MKVLITGGAGYIGSHAAKHFSKSGSSVFVLDNLGRGHEWAVKWSPFIQADLGNEKELKNVLVERKIDAVIHFAAHSCVGESVQNPSLYFRNNVMNTIRLLDAMREANVKYLVFSSTAAVYGHPKTIPIPESHERIPVNPYGETKLFIEKSMEWYGKAYGLKWMALRYFNAAGADPEGEIGEDHRPETHLIPVILETLLGKRRHVEIFGTDYPTPDGTAIRDYIHVTDLAQAHVLALDKLNKDAGCFVYNVGTGHG